MIAEQYVTFETAKLLKQAGFGIPVYDFWEYVGEYVEYRSDCAANHNKHGHLTSRPTQALAARWLREVHGFHLFLKRCYNYNLNQYTWGFWIQRVKYDVYVKSEIGFDSQEEAIEAGLQEAIKMIKSKDYEEDNVQ